MHESNLQSLWAKILRVTLCSPVLLATGGDRAGGRLAKSQTLR